MRETPNFNYTYVFVLDEDFDDQIKQLYIKNAEETNPSLLDALDFLPTAREIVERKTGKIATSVYIKKVYNRPKHSRVVYAYDYQTDDVPTYGWGWAYKPDRDTVGVLELSSVPLKIRSLKSGREFTSWTVAERVADMEIMGRLLCEKFEMIE